MAKAEYLQKFGEGAIISINFCILGGIILIKLQAIKYQDRELLRDTSLEAMANDEWEKMISESTARSHNRQYFEMFIVTEGDTVVGYVSLYAHSPHIISCGPEIKPQYRRQGYAYQAESLALKMSKSLGYTVAVAYVRESNSASIRLHEKLGFEQDSAFVNDKNNEMRLYIMAL